MTPFSRSRSMRVEHLLGHVALRDGACQLEQAVGKRGFAMVDMGDDTEITDMVSHLRGKV